jgi:hypothetical protein
VRDDTAGATTAALAAARKHVRLHVVGEVEGLDLDTAGAGTEAGDLLLEPCQVRTALNDQAAEPEAGHGREKGRRGDFREERAEAGRRADRHEALRRGQAAAAGDGRA